MLHLRIVVALQFYATLNALYAAFCGEHPSLISYASLLAMCVQTSVGYAPSTEVCPTPSCIARLLLC